MSDIHTYVGLGRFQPLTRFAYDIAWSRMIWKNRRFSKSKVLVGVGLAQVSNTVQELASEFFFISSM